MRPTLCIMFGVRWPRPSNFSFFFAVLLLLLFLFSFCQMRNDTHTQKIHPGPLNISFLQQLMFWRLAVILESLRLCWLVCLFNLFCFVLFCFVCHSDSTSSPLLPPSASLLNDWSRWRGKGWGTGSGQWLDSSSNLGNCLAPCHAARVHRSVVIRYLFYYYY